MSENRFAKYAAPQQGGSGNRFAKYGQPDQERDKIIASYAEDIIRRNTIYGGIPQAQLQDPERLYRLAQMEAERAGYKPPQVEKQNQFGSFAIGYGQGGSFGFADEISGAADFVGGTAMGLARGEGFGAIESGKEAYSKRVESDRQQLRMARFDNPLTTIAGELTGGVVTTAPMPASWVGAGARTTGQVALQTADKAAKLQKAAQAATGAKSARLAAQSAALSAKSAKLALPAQTMGQAAGRFGARVGEGVVKGAGYGAAYGGLYGLGAAEGGLGERLDEAATGAAVGGAVGGVLSPAVQFIAAPIVGRIGYGMLTSADDKALDIIIKRAERSGTSLQKVQQDFDAWAKSGEVPETLAELMGPNERSLLSALITVNRETREQATNVFVGRGRGEVNRLEDAFAKSFGASRKDYQDTKAAAAQARAKEAEPFYEGAYIDASTGQRKFLGQQETDALVYEIGGSRVAQSTLSTASDYADALGKRAIRDEIDDFAEAMRAGRPVKPLSVEAADYIERGINRRYGAASRGEAQDIPAGLRGLRDRVRVIIDPSGLGDARATAAEAIRRGELLDEGLGIMSPTVDVDDVNRIIQGVPEAGIAPASDLGRQAYGVGASRAIANELRNVPDMGGFADATRKVARTPALRDKLEAARPKVLTKSGAENKGSKQTKANAALDQAIERASDRAQFGVDMVGNSRTAFRQGDVEDAVLDDAISTQVGQSLSDLLITGVGGAGNQIRDKLARTIGNRLGQPSIYRPNINRAAADVLLATGNDIPKQIARLAARAASRRVSRITMRGLPPPPGSTPPPGRPRPPSGGSPTPSTPIAAGGFAGLRTDLGNAAVGAGVGALGPADSNEERLRNMAIGAGVMGVGGRVSRTVGQPRNALAGGTRTAGVGGPKTAQQAARFETPGSPEYKAASPILTAGIPGGRGPRKPGKDELKNALSGTLQQPTTPLGRGAVNMMGSAEPRPPAQPAQPPALSGASPASLRARIDKLEKEIKSPFTPHFVRVEKLNEITAAKRELQALRQQGAEQQKQQIQAMLPEGMSSERAGAYLRETPPDRWPDWAWKYEDATVNMLVRQKATPQEIKARTGRTVVKGIGSNSPPIVFPPGIDEAKAAQMILAVPDRNMMPERWMDDYMRTRDDLMRTRWNRMNK